MYRTQKTTFYASKQTVQELHNIRRTCGTIWNDCVELGRYYYRLGQKWISKTELQTELKEHYPVHSQTIQAVAHSFIEARTGTREARKKGHNNRYPYKKKFVFNPKWVDKAFEIKDNKLYLSFGNVKGSNGKRRPKLILTLPKVPNGVVKEVEIIFDKQLQVCLSYEDGVEETKRTKGTLTAIDEGEIHTISAVNTNTESLIITGRYIRSIHQLRNKKLKELQEKMSKCKKGSRQWRKYNRAKRFVLAKSEAQLRDALHKTTKEFVDWCIKQDTKEVIVGDVEGVQRNTSKRNKNRKRKSNKKTNQKLSNWSFGKLYQMLEYKLKSKGISIQKVDESYSTQTCPVCGKKKKSSSRNYTCSCGYKKHRDIHGSCNILSKHLYGRFVLVDSKIPTYIRPVTLAKA